MPSCNLLNPQLFPHEFSLYLIFCKVVLIFVLISYPRVYLCSILEYLAIEVFLMFVIHTVFVMLLNWILTHHHNQSQPTTITTTAITSEFLLTSDYSLINFLFSDMTWASKRFSGRSPRTRQMCCVAGLQVISKEGLHLVSTSLTVDLDSAPTSGISRASHISSFHHRNNLKCFSSE